MAELAVLWAVFQKYGIWGVAIAYVVIYHLLWPQYKKAKGQWFSYDTVKDRLLTIEIRHEELEKRMLGELQHNFQQHSDMLDRIDELEKKRK